MSDPMNIGEAAQAAGLTAKMIRDYESLGLIPQARRTESGDRQYTKHDVDVLRFIRQARSLSFSIKQVEQLLSLWSNAQRESRDVMAIAHAHIAELDRKMAELASMKASLEEIASRCPGNDGADCPILGELSGGAVPAAGPRRAGARHENIHCRPGWRRLKQRQAPRACVCESIRATSGPYNNCSGVHRFGCISRLLRRAF